jgi:NTE family protein
MQTLADFLRGAPFELVLSSGFFGFYAHTGVIAAIEEAGLRPARLGGSSAGALIAGMWGAGLPAAAIRDELFRLTREDFWDPDPLLGLRYYARQLLGRAGRVLGEAAGSADSGFGLLRGAAFERLLRDALAQTGVRTFAECAIPVRLSVFDLATRRTAVLGEGELAPAIRASCTFPGMFQPTQIGDARYLDGGIADRPGIATATPGARLLFHHLPAESPWRRVLRSQNHPPAWPELYLLHEPQLPRLSPFHLARGPRAYAMAREMTLRTLAQPPVRHPPRADAGG